MKETMQMSKRIRVVYCVGNETKARFTMFCVKYLTCLLEALMHSTTSIKLLNGNSEEQNLDIRKRVRFEIDMAMIVSIGTHFKWTKALKQKLDACQWMAATMRDVMEMPEKQLTLPRSGNHLSVQVGETEKQRRKDRKREMEAAGEREEVRQCIEMLRELVPGHGGDGECSVKELMGEVVNYVTCLQLQVGALRCLLSSSSSSDSASGIKDK